MTDPMLPAPAKLGCLWKANRPALSSDLREKVDGLIRDLDGFEQPVVAFSGGVDSSVVAGLLTVAKGVSVRLVTTVGPALASRQKRFAQQVAHYLAASLSWVDAGEIRDPGYLANGTDRCYYCKSSLYRTIHAIMEAFPGHTILNGTNLDDLGDHRPGLLAAEQNAVQSPLAAAGLNKAEVRHLASALELPVAELPAAPCLASRIQYGVPVTAARLQRIEKAEAALWALGFSDVRVRLLEGEIASVEVPLPEIDRLRNAELMKSLRISCDQWGFSAVEVQSDGLRSGRLNQLMPVPEVQAGAGGERGDRA